MRTRTIPLLLTTGYLLIAPAPFPMDPGGNGHCQAQAPAPAVEWRSIMAAPRRPAWGTLYSLTSSTPPYAYSTTTLNTALDITTPEASGEDWWFAHCNLYDSNGEHMGYATAGYNTFPNRGTVDQQGCFNYGINNSPDPNELETPDHRKGSSSMWVARYDLDGEQLWCRTYLPGYFSGIAQGHDGSIMVVGQAFGNRRTNMPGPSQVPTRYNPAPGQNLLDLGTVDCVASGLGPMNRKMVVAKVSLDGVLQWNHFYGSIPGLAEGWSTESSDACAIMPLQVNGAPGYYVVGNSTVSTSTNDSGPRVYCLRLDQDGNVVDANRFLRNQAPALPIQLASGNPISALAATAIEHGGKRQIAITGNYLTEAPDPGFHIGSFVWHVPDAENAPYTANYIQHTGSPQLLGTGTAKHHMDKRQRANDVAFVVEGAQLALVWPIAANYTAGYTWSGVNIASLFIHKFTLPSNIPVWSVDKGEIRAYDLQVGVTAASDGEVALVTSKWAPPHTATNDPIGYNELTNEARNCLDTRYGYQANDLSYPHWPTRQYDGFSLYDFWNTDAYVLKVRTSSGATLWETTFDASPDQQAACFPGDLRKQECMYKITQAADGGYVISGNTSRNFDDAYLAKLHDDCQSKLAYNELPLDENGEYRLTSDQTWALDRDLVGKLVVPAGRTLTLNGATIRFADSKQVAPPTHVIVETGGRLVMHHGATLSAVQGCPNSMWDGVQVWGNFAASQTPASNQGYLSMQSGATIEHARIGVQTARGPIGDQLMGVVKITTGGIIHATDAVFHNNIHDVVMWPFENKHHVTGLVTANRSAFVRTQFKTVGDLNNPVLSPVYHAALHGVRGVGFRGCSFSNSIVGTTYDMPYEQGTGIHSVGSTFTVANDCNVLVPLGTPCPAPNTTASSFTNLHYGIVATTVDPGRTFSVSDATFTGTNFGIRMEGIQDAAMHRNTFNVPQPVIPGILGAVYGVYSDQCTGYSIQENTFHTTQPTGLNRKVGLIIKDSGTQYNTFYNNTFNNLYTGSLVQGKNATMNGAVGLEIKCNDYGMAQKNSYDVGLTGSHVYIQGTQGAAIFNAGDPNEWKNPAGNRFSLLHNGGFSLEEDWYVQNSSTFTEYFHHQPTAGNRTRPDHHDLSWLLPSPQGVPWPNDRSLACPSRLEDGGHEVKREAAEQEHAEYGDSKAAYDATKDDGDTYTLLGYVGDPGHSSTQVRNALQSVAPKVSAEVWQTAFERNPTLNAWHITQALLSNSPLQGEVLKMVEFYALPSAYADLVYAAQSGEVNILSLLEGAMARHNGAKAEALSDLGRMAWLDSLQLSASLDSLVWLHDALPSDNQALTRSGVLAAKGEYTALEVLMQAEATASETPDLYEVLKHYATAQQGTGWQDTSAVDVNWLQQLATQRDVVGSAQANAWLHALGHDLPEEIIILPEEGPKNMGNPRNKPEIQWVTGIALEVFPNPSSGPTQVMYEVPEGMVQAELRLVDVHGREQQRLRLGEGPGLLTLTTAGLAPGIYLLELLRADQPLAQSKLILQR